jgi:NADH-quinone oxidoreductase subunit L
MSTSQLAISILLLPAAGAILLAGRGWRLPRIFTIIIGPGVVWASFVITLVLFFGKGSGDLTYWTWIKSGSFEVPFNLLIDNLSLFMCLVITGVGALIVTYSVGYMEREDDASYARFFTYMDVFIFSMLLLVLAGNFVFLIVGWAMVGLSSYLLIGFWYQRRSAVLAARKAFVMNVIGDVGMILGAFVLFVMTHQTTYTGVFRAATNYCAFNGYCTLVLRGDGPGLELAAFLLLVGAVAKSAQLPLHTWLPDAMEGPTPVSALIHAATMVTAGVYLIGRMQPIYDIATYAHGAVAIIGAVTALFAASIAIVQVDIKRVLAYSTMSQIGYMFLAVGIGAYSAGFFHLLSHAFFKALLFMAAGNVIHSMHDEQDMRKYGGLFRQLPRTSGAFLIGSLALVGVIPLGHRPDHRLLHRPHVVDGLRWKAVARPPGRAPARGQAGHAGSRPDPGRALGGRRVHPDARPRYRALARVRFSRLGRRTGAMGRERRRRVGGPDHDGPRGAAVPGCVPLLRRADVEDLERDLSVGAATPRAQVLLRRDL